jgi:hypothetical protein
MKLSNIELSKWIDLNIHYCNIGIEYCSSENEFNYFYGKIESLETVKKLLITNEEEWKQRVTLNTTDFCGVPFIEKRCHHMYSRDFFQKYPRICLLCGEREE